MHSLNEIHLAGVLDTDPEFHTLFNGQPIGVFTLATARNHKIGFNKWEKNPEWHKIVVFNKDLIKILKALKKGAQVSLEGRLSYEVWEKDPGRGQVFKRKKACVALRDKDSKLTVYRPIDEPPLKRLNNPPHPQSSAPSSNQI